MLRNYFVIAWRNLWKHKAFSLINIMGLAIGLACSILIYLWVQDELSYDRFHQNGKNLYKVMVEQNHSTGSNTVWEWTPGPLGPTLLSEVPEIKQVVRMSSYQMELLLTYDHNTFPEKGCYADSVFFEVFSFPLLSGDAATALDDPNSIVISNTLARKYFGNENPVGKSMTIKGEFGSEEQELTVTGVFQDIPANSSIQFDFVLSFQAFLATAPWAKRWGNFSFFTFIQLHPESILSSVAGKVKNVIRDHHHEGGQNTELFLHPFEKMYLYNDFSNGKSATGRIRYIYIFSLAAFFILLIACINFINLSTARSSIRAREVGVRKVSGAPRFALISQFLGESLIITFLAASVAGIIVTVALPFFNQLINKNIVLPIGNIHFVLILLGALLVTGVAAGSYPALILSSLQPDWVLRGATPGKSGKYRTREVLVVFQYVLSIALIVSTLIIYKQIDYIKNKNLGFDKENIIYFPVHQGIKQHKDAFRNDLMSLAGIQNISFTNSHPLTVENSTSDPEWEGKPDTEDTYFYILQTDEDFIGTMDVTILEGRDFVKDNPEGKKQYIINERAAEVMGIKDPIGEKLTFWDDREGEIVGLVQNFHHQPLHHSIEPLIILLNPANTWFAFLRVNNDNVPETLAAVESIYNKYETNFPLEYHFLDQYIQRIYKSEITTGKLANIFAFLAIFISGLGLFGLALHTIDRRTKEIGIRKILGATVRNLIILLTKDFTRLVLIAFAIAIPVSWVAMHRWLANFAYRVDVEWSIFIIAGIVAIVTAWLTVSYQTIKAAFANPVDSLRTE